MTPYEHTRFEVQDHLDSLLAERRRDDLAGAARRATPGPSPWRRLLAIAGLALIRLGERLRGEPDASLHGTAQPLRSVTSQHRSQRHS